MERETHPPDEAELIRLLQTSGRRRQASGRATEVAKVAARAAWRSQVQRTRRGRRTVRTVLAVAAAVAILIGLGLWTPRGARSIAAIDATRGGVTIGGRDVAEGLSLRAGDWLATGKAGGAAFRLAAGPSIRVDAESRLRIQTGGDLELERGGIYVDSTPDAEKSAKILVQTELGVVRELGTQYEVRLLVNEGQPSEGVDSLRIRVREGAVRLESARSEVEVNVGEELLFHHDGTMEWAEVAAAGSQWDWIERVRAGFDVEGASLDSFLDWVSRESGLSWGLAEPELAEEVATTVVHGSIDGLTTLEALELVLPTSGFHYRRDGDRLVLELDAR